MTLCLAEVEAYSDDIVYTNTDSVQIVSATSVNHQTSENVPTVQYTNI